MFYFTNMPKKPCLTNEQIERVKQLYANGERVVNIKYMVNRSKSAIYAALKKFYNKKKCLKTITRDNIIRFIISFQKFVSWE